jgi:hypothetical protein
MVPATNTLVDAEAVARYLDVSRDWVYEHAELLRARRLGAGPRARLRFSLDDIDGVLTCLEGRKSARCESPAPTPIRRRRRRTSLGTSGELLPIRRVRRASRWQERGELGGGTRETGSC